MLPLAKCLCTALPRKPPWSLNLLKPLDTAIGQVPLHRIAPETAMVAEFVETTQNTNKTQLLATNYGYGTF